MKKSLLLFLGVFFGFLGSLSAQQATLEGQEFWLGFLENSSSPAEVKLFITSSQASANVTVRIPTTGNVIFQGNIDFAAETNNTKEIILNATDVIPSTAEIAENKGVQISSDAAIFVAASNAFLGSVDATSLVPSTIIGDICDYYTTNYAGGTSQVVVVAMQDLAAGDARITPSLTTTGGKTAGTAFDLPAMQAGQIYQIKATGDLTGTRIESCKPVAVFSGVDSAPVQTGCVSSNHLFTQMFPTATWGNSFFLAPPIGDPNSNAESVIRVVASMDNTTITVDSTTTLTIASKGGFQDINLTAATCIVASNPVSVVNLLKSEDCDNFAPQASNPAMAVLSPVERGAVNQASFTTINRTSVNLHYVVIIAQNTNPSNVNMQLNGTTIAPNLFNSFPNCSDYVYARVPLTNTDASKYELNSANSPFIAYVHGVSADESYFYIAASQYGTTAASVSAGPACPTNPITFTAQGPGIVEWIWNFGDGSPTITQTGEGPVTTDYTYTDAGTFDVSVIVTTEKGCVDTVTTQVTVQQPTPEIDNPSYLCPGDTLELDPGVFDTYEWSDGSTERVFRTTSTGTYSVKLTQGVCVSITTFEVEVAPLEDLKVIANPQPSSYTINGGVTEVAMICKDNGETFTLSIDGSPTAVVWKNPDGSETINATITVADAGTYTAQIQTSNGCTISDSIIFEEACETQVFVPDAFTPNGDGVNDNLEFFGTGTSVFDLKIMNRWGEIVHIANSREDVWDGTYRGVAAPAGVYVWVLTYNSVFDGSEVVQRGKVQLIR